MGGLEGAAEVAVRGGRLIRSTGPSSPEPEPTVSDAAPQTYDLVILGAGTGGYSAAFRAGQLGLTVALVDAYKIGGTCLHIGCIPTKAMLESADLLRPHQARRQLRDHRREPVGRRGGHRGATRPGRRATAQGAAEPRPQEQGRLHPRSRPARRARRASGSSASTMPTSRSARSSSRAATSSSRPARA